MEEHESGCFAEETSVEVVANRNRNAKDPRLKEVMEVITRKPDVGWRHVEPHPVEHSRILTT